MNENSLNLLENKYLNLHRHGRFLQIDFKVPHGTLSTCPQLGGYRNDLSGLINHQSCEGKGHEKRIENFHGLSPAEYHQLVLNEAGMKEGSAYALMGTAANMKYAAIQSLVYEELEVTAIVTAGVQGNAGRAGDSAKWHESENGWSQVPNVAGTINTFLLFNWPLTASALVRAVATMTEAKSVALEELGVGSKSSIGKATGTGTDQFHLAAPIDERKAKQYTGKHVKCGELIGQSVILATKEALRWQNGLEASMTRFLPHILGRFGLNEDQLKQKLFQLLDSDSKPLLEKNWNSLVYEPSVASCCFAISECLDRQRYGAIPDSAHLDVLIGLCAQLASQLSTKREQYLYYWDQLSQKSTDSLELVLHALALGWQDKWSISG